MLGLVMVALSLSEVGGQMSEWSRTNRMSELSEKNKMHETGEAEDT